ncbi:MAG TPA: alpha/beta hydrolase [Bryobacteraceae bacterium]|jgi:pimeloyl-ACP methyl ester carboxylesterase|nr:alpha/beta hydrolase [Bryobacteraceae bacterium]
MLWIIAAIGAAAALLAGALLHRKLRQRKISASMQIRGARWIVEQRFVRIGGIDQWIGIRGEDRVNPALLVIHGGPGSPSSIFTPLIRSWEKHFTVIQWDQRGSGKTLGRTGVAGVRELTMDRLTRDGIEVAEFVCSHLGKNKITLLACSFGSTFGLSMVRRRPDLFCAYVGTDQNVGMVRNREPNHKAVLERLRANGLNKGVAALEKIGHDPSRWTPQDFITTAKWTMQSDPHTYRRIMKLLKSAIWFSPGHTLRDIQLIISGMKLSIARLFREVPSFDAWQEGTRFEIPFFIIQGENDVLTTPSQAKAYFDDVTAPVKSMTLIRDAGHFTAFIQPDQFLNELLTVAQASSQPVFPADHLPHP